MYDALSARGRAATPLRFLLHVARRAYSFRRDRSSDLKPEVDERLEGIGKSLRQSRKEEHGKRAVRRQGEALRRASPIEVLDVKRQALRDADCRGDQRHDHIFAGMAIGALACAHGFAINASSAPACAREVARKNVQPTITMIIAMTLASQSGKPLQAIDEKEPVEHEEHAVIGAPGDIGPSRAVPNPRSEEADPQIEVGARFAAPIAAEREI